MRDVVGEVDPPEYERPAPDRQVLSAPEGVRGHLLEALAVVYVREPEEAAMTDVVAFDEAKAGAFAEKMTGMLNGAALAIQASVGHQSGLFDTMSTLPPSTSEEIARAAGLHERYVREWLGAMVVGGIVSYDADAATYSLPPEHAAFTTRAAGPMNLASVMQMVAMVGEVEQKVLDCFRNGGGVPYSEYPRFQELMAEESAGVHDAALIDGILPMVDGIVDALEAGIDVADIGCGRGHAINLMAKTFPKSRFTGFDISADGVQAGRDEAAELGLTNATFVEKDVAALGLTDSFDFVTAFDAIHDQVDPAGVLAGIAQALRRGGTFLMVDIRASSHVHENVEHPIGPFLYTVSTFHCMTVSLAHGGAGLGTVWGEQTARSMLADAGFRDIEIKHIDEDIANSYYIAKT